MPLAIVQVRFYGLYPDLSCSMGLANPQGQTQVHHRQQEAPSPVRPESWYTSLASIGYCGGVQHGEIKSAPETRRGARGGSVEGKPMSMVTVGNHRRGRVASERSEIVSSGLTFEAQTVIYS
jgi:hypothetical protein